MAADSEIEWFHYFDEGEWHDLRTWTNQALTYLYWEAKERGEHDTAAACDYILSTSGTVR